MKNLCVVPLCLDAWSTNNWNLDAQPVAILNEASTLHERVAYCHGLAHGMQKVAELLYENDSEGVASAAGFFSVKSHPSWQCLSAWAQIPIRLSASSLSLPLPGMPELGAWRSRRFFSALQNPPRLEYYQGAG